MTVHRNRPLRRPGADGVAETGIPGVPESTPVTSTRRWRLADRLIARLRDESGDVPGWVLITLMTAGIVVALWAVASDQIVRIFENAMAPFLGGSL